MKSKHAKIYKNQKRISKEILTLSENPCKTELRCFSDLNGYPGRNEVLLKRIHDVHKQKNNLSIS